MSCQMGKLVEIDELVECGVQAKALKLHCICQSQSTNCNRAFIHSPI